MHAKTLTTLRTTLAHAGRRSRLRLPDRHAHIRAALVLRVFPDADVERAWLGPRCLRARLRDSEFAVGHRSAVRGRRRRQVRHRARALHRHRALCGGPRLDDRFDDARHARYHRRRADRFRAFRLLVQYRALRFRKNHEAGVARPRARPRHRRRLVRPVSVRAVRRGADRQLRAGRQRSSSSHVSFSSPFHSRSCSRHRRQRAARRAESSNP